MEFTQYGSALSVFGAQVDWTDTSSEFSNNISEQGGAVFIANPQTITLTSTKFSQNIS
jgi:hypothetical protein